jgi:hypothetical protein
MYRENGMTDEIVESRHHPSSTSPPRLTTLNGQADGADRSHRHFAACQLSAR